MKKNFLLLSFAITFVALVFNTNKVNSNITAPPPGNTGDQSPANTCGLSSCHNTTPQAPANGDLTFGIGTGNPTTPLDNNFEYTPGTQYNLGFVINASANRYGFQVSATKAGLAQAGTFALTNTSNTSMANAFSRTYVGHKSASTFKNWVFKWTAPAAGTGPVTFYYTYNLANGDGTDNGDQIYIGTVTINEAGGVGVRDITDYVSDLSVFPNPVTSHLAFSFDLKEEERVSARLYSVDGRLQSLLMDETVYSGKFNRSFDAGELSSGVYFLKLQVGNSSVTKKIFKQ